MKRFSFLKMLLSLSLMGAIFSCGSDNADEYEKVSPVTVDLNAVPYQKLSDYKFFEGELKNLSPAYKVLPYDLTSSLFSDYAHKKRFVWMPENTHATYAADGKILDFPSGTALIKSFYYENVQPDNSTRIIETRLMIKKSEGWVFAVYIWNDAQSEAFLDMKGAYANISWKEKDVVKNVNYRIPSRSECFTCHKTSSDTIPIGPKPQNLNRIYNYTDGTRNQLEKWIKEGYLKSAPETITSMADWTDESLPLELRVRSYLDVNCAHCHTQGSHCDYRPLRLAFSETINAANMGVCIAPQENINPALTKIVAKQVPLRSVMHYRMKSFKSSERMPLLGRDIVHDEGLKLIEDWIKAMDAPCP